MQEASEVLPSKSIFGSLSSFRSDPGVTDDLLELADLEERRVLQQGNVLRLRWAMRVKGARGQGEGQGEVKVKGERKG